MEITIRYFGGCPNWRTAQARLEEVFSELPLGARPTVGLEAVETAEAADRLAFRGSPTLLIDGVDPFADDSAPVGLSCRVYMTESGFQGAPSVEQLREALAAPPRGLSARPD